MNRWLAKADADWLKNYTTERQVPSHELHPNTPSVLISPHWEKPGWLWVSVLICFIIRSWSKSRDSCTVIRGGEVEDEGRGNRTHYKNSFMWGRARDHSPKNTGEQIVVFESPPLARAHVAWDDPGPDAQAWAKPWVLSKQNFFWLHDNLSLQWKILEKNHLCGYRSRNYSKQEGPIQIKCL